MAWSNCQYLAGLRQLGHDVHFVEDSDDYPSCYDPVRDVTDTDPSYGLAFADQTFRRLDLAEHWAYHDAHRNRWLGPAGLRIRDVLASADLLLDLCGVNPLRPWLLSIPARVLVDEDPAFTQIRHLTNPAAMDRALQHTAFFSFGANVNRRGCRLPSDGLPWQPTRQPVALSTVPCTPGRARGRFTTVMQWASYLSLRHRRTRYGMKADSFQPFIGLPRRVGAAMEIALGASSDVRRRLAANGWHVRDARQLTKSVESYQRYIRSSKAEFSVAKHGYVISRSGWFSERSVAYLASGRPIVVQDTGFSDWLPTGAGVRGFSTLEEAIGAVEAVDRDYAHHCRAARAVAEEYFDASRVLPPLIDAAMRPARPVGRDPRSSREPGGHRSA
jgi:hypothetical protein